MSTYTKILYQVVFGSKNRIPFISKPNRDILFNYIAGILWNKKCHTHIVGGHKNHIHIIFNLHPTITLSSLVKDIKKASDLMMKKERTLFHSFPGWQVGYGAFTYSADSLDNLIRYVRNQEEHHKRRSFREEYLAFLKENGIEFNEKYLLV